MLYAKKHYNEILMALKKQHRSVSLPHDAHANLTRSMDAGKRASLGLSA